MRKTFLLYKILFFQIAQNFAHAQWPERVRQRKSN